tara:strand:+ start:1713 stop:2804 length:1092 start_codon:yes stop_codon:yes gene_type:complete
MELLSTFKIYFMDVFNQGSLGLTLMEIAILLISLMGAFAIRGLVAKLIVAKIKKIVQKTGNVMDDQLFESLAPPLKLLPLLFIFILTGLLIDPDSKLTLIIEKINRTFVTIFVFWLLHQSLMPLTHAFQKLEELLSKTLVIWLTRSLKYLIIFLGVVAVLETWGIKIGPVIAGLGLFGVAVALGAQDLFKNLISGILIITERRFNIGEIISVPNQAMGTVEHIGFRSTLIRQFDTSLISLPNYVFSDSSIINYSKRKYRRINWIIGLEYNSTIEQIKKFTESIIEYLSTDKNFIVNDDYKTFVRLDKFNDSSIDILIYTFTSTNDWETYLRIKESLALKIKKDVEKFGLNFAFPSHSIYIEKN